MSPPPTLTTSALTAQSPTTEGNGPIDLQHDYPFDPSYGYDLERLLAIEPPAEPAGFTDFWTARYERARTVDPAPTIRSSALTRAGRRAWDVEYTSTDGATIRGWLLEPVTRPVTRGFVVGLGYLGMDRPEHFLPCDDAAYLVPCPRGLGRSAAPTISPHPRWHVLHDIDDRDSYVLGGCVEDLWTGVSALLALRPAVAGRVDYLGESFGGGIGALALPWDPRIGRAHLDVPTFGHHPLRLTLPTTGSGAAVQAYARDHVHVGETLAFYDSSVAATHIYKPVHVAAALFDPVVAPPGQFAVHNALPEPHRLFVRRAGHFTHPDGAAENRRLLSELRGFFSHDDENTPPLAQPTPRS